MHNFDKSKLLQFIHYWLKPYEDLPKLVNINEAIYMLRVTSIKQVSSPPSICQTISFCSYSLPYYCLLSYVTSLTYQWCFDYFWYYVMSEFWFSFDAWLPTNKWMRDSCRAIGRSLWSGIWVMFNTGVKHFGIFLF